MQRRLRVRSRSQRLPRLVGKGKALELILTGAQVAADEALRIGLVSRVVPSADLIRESTAMADALAANSPIDVSVSGSAPLPASNQGAGAGGR